MTCMTHMHLTTPHAYSGLVGYTTGNTTSGIRREAAHQVVDLGFSFATKDRMFSQPFSHRVHQARG